MNRPKDTQIGSCSGLNLERRKAGKDEIDSCSPDFKAGALCQLQAGTYLLNHETLANDTKETQNLRAAESGV
jgi:hypothetical protein